MMDLVSLEDMCWIPAENYMVTGSFTESKISAATYEKFHFRYGNECIISKYCHL